MRGLELEGRGSASLLPESVPYSQLPIRYQTILSTSSDSESSKVQSRLGQRQRD